MAWLLCEGGKKKEKKTQKNKTKRNRNTFITHGAGERKPNGREHVATKSIRSEKKIL